MKKIIFNTHINKTVTVSLLTALGVIFIGGACNNLIYNGNTSELFRGITTIFAALVASIGGVAQIIKRESPLAGKTTIKGKYAVITGWFWICFCIFIIGITVFSMFLGE